MTSSWRRITTWDAPPAFNMGLDEALLELGTARPTLRFYTWQPDALSLGYFQRFADVPATADATEVVRRVTGGGAIHHVAELTFSITAPLDHPLYRGPVADSYARVHAALARALTDFGVAAELRGARPLDSDRASTGMCFHHSTDLDLAWTGGKGVGSAQRRKGGRVLHHGSIKLAPSALEEGIASIRPAGDPVAASDVADSFAAALGTSFELTFEDEAPSEAELLHAYRHGPTYGSQAFVHRR